jgi:hypothetical protein
MQKYIRRSLPLILFALLSLSTHAQKKGYSQGYIINSEGETIDGWVKDRSTGTFIELYKKIRFQADKNRGSRKYGPDDILGYGYNDLHFESMPLMEESSFFQFRYYLDDGYDPIFLRIISRNRDLTYYHWEWIDSESNYLDYTPLFHREGSSEMVRVTQGILGLKKNRLSEYFRDCPELVKAIENKWLTGTHEVFNFYIDRCGKDLNGI